MEFRCGGYRLQQAKAGIICLTPSNMHADWLLFEAGALSKQVENTFVCPLLIGLEPADVKGPLAQFQATRLTKVEVLHLLKTLYRGVADGTLTESHIDEVFDVWWPKLETTLNNIPTEKAATTRPERSERDLLEEILSLVRNQNRDIQSSAKKVDSLTSRVLLEILQRADPSITSVRVTEDDPATYRIHAVDEKGREYHLNVMRGAPVSAVKAMLFAAMGKTVNPTDEDS